MTGVAPSVPLADTRSGDVWHVFGHVGHHVALLGWGYVVSMVVVLSWWGASPPPQGSPLVHPRWQSCLVRPLGPWQGCWWWFGAMDLSGAQVIAKLPCVCKVAGPPRCPRSMDQNQWPWPQLLATRQMDTLECVGTAVTIVSPSARHLHGHQGQLKAN